MIVSNQHKDIHDADNNPRNGNPTIKRFCIQPRYDGKKDRHQRPIKHFQLHTSFSFHFDHPLILNRQWFRAFPVTAVVYVQYP